MLRKNYLKQWMMGIALISLIFMLPVFAGPEDEYSDIGNYTQIILKDPDVRLGAFERQGSIRRLFGEAFSHGSTPEQSAECFLKANAQLFGVNAENLVGPFSQPIVYLQKENRFKFYGLNYTQEIDGIPVFRARLVLLVRNEKNYPLVLASADLRDLGMFKPEVHTRVLSPDRGIWTAGRTVPSLVNFTKPELVIWAGVDNMVVDPVLAYTFIGDNGYKPGAPEPEKYLFVVDATTGEVLYQENLIIDTDVTGNVQGNATQGKGAEHCEAELPEPMSYGRVNIGSTAAYADTNGDFVIPNPGSSPVTVASPLRGLWFWVHNQAGSDAVLYDTVIPPGPANFLHNEPNTSEFYRAQVNGYLQANIVRDFTLTYNPAYPGLQQNEFPVNVNIASYCNAYYDYSSINFYRAGGGCPNTAFSTVIHHEYGHHLVSMAGSGQDAYGEGMGDVMGVLILDDAGLAYGFYMDCDTPLRNADNDLQYPCSGEIHYCGMLLSGCVWSTRNELTITNPLTYRDIISNLAVNAMLLHTGSDIDPSITIDYLTLDDDNGNIYDGTPHYWEIAAGFGAHNMDAPELAFLSFEFPNGLPEIINPDGGTTVRVEVSGVMAEPQPGTGMFYYNSGSGWSSEPMTEVTPNIYDAVFPTITCGLTVSYYFSAQTTEGDTQLWPMHAPDEIFKTVSAEGYEVIFEDNFNANLGWTVENDPGLTSGAWDRGIPVGGGVRGDPPSDYDGSGYCYVTQNLYGDYDIDGGRTWLISPTLDLSQAANATVHYALWYTNNFGNEPNNDLFYTYVSSDNGATWILAETIGPVTESGWKEHDFVVSDFVALSDQVKVRFEASDLNDGSVVEAGIDQFSATIYTCAVPDVSIEIIPDNPPVIVPPGGSFTYTGILTNNLSQPQTVDAWIMARLPNGHLWGPTKLYNNINLAPNQVLQVDNLRQNVPPNAPAGVYEYIAFCGDYPNTIIDQASFPVTVTSSAKALED